jgi:hypothetical protein
MIIQIFSQCDPMQEATLWGETYGSAYETILSGHCATVTTGSIKPKNKTEVKSFFKSTHDWNMQPSNHHQPKICTSVFQKTNVPYLCRIWGSHRSGYNIVQPVESQSTFRKSITPPSSGLLRNLINIPTSSYILVWLILKPWRWR